MSLLIPWNTHISKWYCGKKYKTNRSHGSEHMGFFHIKIYLQPGKSYIQEKGTSSNNFLAVNYSKICIKLSREKNRLMFKVWCFNLDILISDNWNISAVLKVNIILLNKFTGIGTSTSASLGTGYWAFHAMFLAAAFSTRTVTATVASYYL